MAIKMFQLDVFYCFKPQSIIFWAKLSDQLKKMFKISFVFHKMQKKQKNYFFHKKQ
jgi:hypothetical protein